MVQKFSPDTQYCIRNKYYTLNVLEFRYVRHKRGNFRNSSQYKNIENDIGIVSKLIHTKPVFGDFVAL